MIFTRGLRVCLAAQPASLRGSFEGLALLVKEVLKEDERSSLIFVVTNWRRDRIRLLYWDGTGLWLMTKKPVYSLLSQASKSRSSRGVRISPTGGIGLPAGVISRISVPGMNSEPRGVESSMPAASR